MNTDPTTYVGADNTAVRHLELDPRPADVLAVGSQLAYGSVGLNAALPVYDEHGLRCAAVPTTVLSVLPHYPSVHRTDLSGRWLAEALHDLDLSGALAPHHLVSVGYLASPDHADVIADWFRSRTGSAADVPLVLDPTLGDVDLGFYNDPDLVPALKHSLVPMATGLTPNLFELAQLTGRPLSSLTRPEAVTDAARELVTGRVRWVVVTGLRGMLPDGPDHGPGPIGELVLTRDTVRTLTHPAIPDTPVGVGDTFTASLVARLLAGDELLSAVDAAAVHTARRIRRDVP